MAEEAPDAAGQEDERPAVGQSPAEIKTPESQPPAERVATIAALSQEVGTLSGRLAEITAQLEALQRAETAPAPSADDESPSQSPEKLPPVLDKREIVRRVGQLAELAEARLTAESGGKFGSWRTWFAREGTRIGLAEVAKRRLGREISSVDDLTEAELDQLFDTIGDSEQQGLGTFRANPVRRWARIGLQVGGGLGLIGLAALNPETVQATDTILLGLGLRQGFQGLLMAGAELVRSGRRSTQERGPELLLTERLGAMREAMRTYEQGARTPEQVEAVTEATRQVIEAQQATIAQQAERSLAGTWEWRDQLKLATALGIESFAQQVLGGVSLGSVGGEAAAKSMTEVSKQLSGSAIDTRSRTIAERRQTEQRPGGQSWELPRWTRE